MEGIEEKVTICAVRFSLFFFFGGRSPHHFLEMYDIHSKQIGVKVYSDYSYLLTLITA